VVATTLPPSTVPATTLPTPTEPAPTITIPPPVIPSDVLFDVGRAELMAAAEPYLQELATQIRNRYPGARLHFVGHTDSRGSAESNADLSQRRADAVMEWFATHGFERSRLSAVGAGEDQPIASDTDAQGHYDEAAGRRNRRVQINIME
jgi:outer membrane protein OmpA-like peptidoglycan-associated protein